MNDHHHGYASDKAALWGYISRYVPDANPKNQPFLDRLVDHALAYYRDVVVPTRRYRAPSDRTFAEETMLYIDPEVCIDCGACEPACPVQAIFPEDLVPEQWKHYTEMNAAWYRK